MLLQKFFINVAFANILNGRTNFYDSLRPNYQKSSKFVHRMKPKTGFLAVSSKKRILLMGYGALQVDDMNVAIANNLVNNYMNSFYDLPGQIFFGNRQTLEKSVAQNALIASSSKIQRRPNVLSII